MKRHKEAELACRKALASQPDSMPAAVQLFGLLHSTQQHSAALDALAEAQKQLQQAPALQQQLQLKQVRWMVIVCSVTVIQSLVWLCAARTFLFVSSHTLATQICARVET